MIQNSFSAYYDRSCIDRIFSYKFADFIFKLRIFSLKTIQINPLVTDQLYLACMAKFLILNKEGIIENISYENISCEHHAYI